MNIRKSLKKLLFKTADFIFVALVLALSMILLLICTGQDPFDWSTYDERTNTVWHYIDKLINISAGRIAVLLLIPVVLLLTPIYLLVLARVKRGWFKRTYKNKVASARDYIRSVDTSKKEYCLILRPFGNDAYFSMQNINSEYLFSMLFLNWSKGIVLEQMIEKLVRENCGAETVALVDPVLRHIPSTPTFISAGDDNWRAMVFDLMKRAMLVFVIISPGQELRSSLIWEMTKLIQLGMLGRFVLVIPPQRLKKNARTIHEIKKKLFFLADDMDELRNSAFLVFPKQDLSAFQAYNGYSALTADKKLKYREVLGLAEYEGILKKVIQEMMETIHGRSYREKYMYASREFSTDDNKFSAEYLMMLLRTRKEGGTG
jgi:hypothetical protein